MSGSQNENKKSEKIDKYLNLARGLTKLWNMSVTLVPIVVDALGTVPKGLEKGLEGLEFRGRIKIILSTALKRSAEKKRPKETWCHSVSSKR